MTAAVAERRRVAPRPIARDAVGIGLRPAHYAAIAEAPPEVDFFEVIAENLLGRAGPARDHAAAVARRYPLVAHGVSMDLVGVEPIDEAHLAAFAALVRAHRMPWATDHLCWSASEGRHHHELLPPPLLDEAVGWAADRIRRVQAALDVPFGVENVSSYVAWGDDEMPEWTFLRRVVEAADCGVLLDLNNVVVSAHNQAFSPLDYLDAVPWDRVLEVHLAGHEARPDGLRHDTHDRAVDDEVWALYAEAWRRGGPFPTLVEWDDAIPALDVVVAEARRARAIRR
ncbi:MAG TPA: DUF692 domain-containing protein [Myxococcota bacterium]|nr:DUF692 domain-containing protein [Myxococcota bacterium]